MAGKIKKGLILDLARQNRAMREILEEWPAREIMMDFEKAWNEKRTEFLRQNPPIQIDLESEFGRS